MALASALSCCNSSDDDRPWSDLSNSLDLKAHVLNGPEFIASVWICGAESGAEGWNRASGVESGPDVRCRLGSFPNGLRNIPNSPLNNRLAREGRFWDA